MKHVLINVFPRYLIINMFYGIKTFPFIDSGVDYGWRLVSRNNSLSYICEISQQDAYTILTQKRDFSKPLPRS